MRPIEPLCLGIGFGDADDLRKGGAIRRIILTHFGDALPITSISRRARNSSDRSCQGDVIDDAVTLMGSMNWTAGAGFPGKGRSY